MSYEYGIAALKLEMPPVVPRTEYSAEFHWPLVNAVTGSNVSASSPKDQLEKASQNFVRAWDYSFIWSILIYNQVYKGFYTKMGHAEYASEGADFSKEVTCPFKSPEQVLAFDPFEKFGLIDNAQAVKNFNEDYRDKLKKFPDAVNMTGIYVTIMSGLIEIFGWDMLLLACGTDSEKFGRLTNRYTDWILQYFNALAQSDSPVVMIHDDIVWTSGAFLPPAWYRKYIFPNYKKLFAPLRDAGKIIVYTSDGNYTEFIDDVASTGINAFVLEPSTDMQYIADKYGKTHAFIGNADTRILLDGSKQDIENEVKRCMHIGKNCPGFFMAVGNHIPSNTPIENALYYNEIYKKLSKR